MNKFVVVRYIFTKCIPRDKTIIFTWAGNNFVADEIIEEFDNEEDALSFSSELNEKYAPGINGRIHRKDFFMVLNTEDNEEDLSKFYI